MSNLSKTGLINLLKNTYGHFIVAQFGRTLLLREDWSTFPSEIKIEENNICYTSTNGTVIRDVMTDEAGKRGVLDEIRKLHIRTILTDSYELIYEYCRQSKQLDLLKIQSWFEFARILRNTLSHGWKGSRILWPRHLKNTEVKWRHRSITKNMNGQKLKFSTPEALKLHEDMTNFVTGLS